MKDKNNILDTNYLSELDNKVKLLSITFDPIFKGIFGSNIELLKDFILSVLEIDIDRDKCKIRLLNNELPIENYTEYKKFVYLNIVLNDDIFIEIEINRSDFNKVKRRNFIYQNKMYSMIPENGDDSKDLDNVIFYQLNLNTENKTETYGEHVIVPYDTTIKEIYIDNYYTILKYLEFYHKLYYTKSRKLERGELWLAALMSKSFSELYDILSKVLSSDKLKLMIEETKRMSLNDFNLHAWKKQEMDDLVIREGNRISREEGIEAGINYEKTETIKNMLKEKANYEFINKVTGKSIKEIKEIEKSMKD